MEIDLKKAEKSIERLKKAGLDGTYYFAVFNAMEQLERLIENPNHLSAEKLEIIEKYIWEIKKYHKDEIVAYQEEKVEIPLNIYGKKGDNNDRR